MKRTFSSLLLASLSVIPLSAAVAGATDAGRAGPGGAQIRFNPSTIVAGQYTVLSWSSPQAVYCEVLGIPDLVTGSPMGSEGMRPTRNLTAELICEGAPAGANYARADLTVLPPDTKPVVRASFSPSSIYAGQSSSLVWSSDYALSCSASGSIAAAVGATSGSTTVSPTSSGSVTVTCSNDAGQTSATAHLTVSLTPPPQVWLSVYPTVLQRPGWVDLLWSSANATHCSYGGPSGSYRQYFLFSGADVFQCFGPGGTTTRWYSVTVLGFTAKAGKADTFDLGRLGIEAGSNGVSAKRADFNNDGIDDVLVVNALDHTAQVFVGTKKGTFRLAKTVEGVPSLESVSEVFFPADGDDSGIRIQSQQ
ncbi:FG-GAP repeat domain-containing protein [Tahibacter amnicola]|uniref:VCBS repeat-containing protein n=1 Tax=Tahibacter amnicola TaxID=2976241 RepID=A0ABY6BJ90_9GAMM|nr:VCBS repeat-containing protein [Tahibacter amnicola]UXI70083.1 VCBS repeat-containing protein [Tahibacter amnicola]